MQLTTKEAVCDYVNSKVTFDQHHPREDLWRIPFLGRFFPSFFAIREVHVPIYTKAWKIKAIRALQKKVHAWHPRYALEEMDMENWACRLDFSKHIWPDQWKTYSIKKPIAIAKYTTEHEHCWTIYPMQEFYQEDLSYGIRPIAIYEQLVAIGGAYVWVVKKQSHSIYAAWGSDAFFLDVPQDFKLFLEQQPCSINWKEQQIA